MPLFRHHYRWLPLIAYLALFFVLIPCARAAPLESESSPGIRLSDSRDGADNVGSFPLLVGGGVQHPHEDSVAEIAPFFLFLVIIGVAVAAYSQLQDSTSSTNK
jgi:hypothetical protein